MMICCPVLYLHVSDKTTIRPTMPLQYFWECIMPVRPKILNWIRHKIQHHCWNQFLVFLNKILFDQHHYGLCLVYHHLMVNFSILYVGNATKCTWWCEYNKVFCLCVFSIFSSIELFATHVFCPGSHYVLDFIFRTCTRSKREGSRLQRTLIRQEVCLTCCVADVW